MTNGLDRDQTCHNVWPDLGQICLQSLKQMALVGKELSKTQNLHCFLLVSSQEGLRLIIYVLK